jgi:hypothetical protein
MLFACVNCTFVAMGTKKQQFSLEIVFLIPGVLLGAVTFVATTTDCCRALGCILKIKNSTLYIIW